jgi:uncharacterized protein YndB with AHSA1/START domain
MSPTGNLTITTPSDLEIEIVREFDAPRALVFEAYTRPELIKRWLGAFGGWSLTVCEFDARPGGAYRYVWTGPGKPEMGMGGIIREIVAPERIVATERFDQAWYEGEGSNTVVFTERAGRTTVTTTLRYKSKNVRDGVLKSPMDTGMGASFDALAALLAERA